MYEFIRAAHSIIRWFAFFALLIAVIRSWAGLFGKKQWMPLDRKLGGAVIGSLHTQFLLGLLLYAVFSPLTRAAFSNMGAAMKDPALRFWAVEHIFIAFIGIAVSQATMVLSRKAEQDAQRFKRAAIGYTLGFICIVAAIPWPGREAVGRALLPF